jgi:4-azaleucine resistance transporter AzlC
METKLDTSYSPTTTLHTRDANSWIHGIKAGIPIALGYIPIAIAFGILAKSSGIPSGAALLMSLLVYAGASQFVGINLLALGTPYWLIVFTTFVLNSRHFLMSASLTRRLAPPVRTDRLLVASFGITDETFTVASLSDREQLPLSYIIALNMTAFSAWNAGTWIGLFLGQSIPASIQSSMGIALYAMFIGLLVPSMRKSRQVAILAVASALLNTVLQQFNLFGKLSIGLNVVLTTILVSGLGAVLFKGESE